MKTNEFIKEVEAMGYKVERYENGLLIEDFHGIEHACVAEHKMYKINTSYAGFDSMPNTEQEQLFNLLTEYASTPIEEREEEKKYIYRVKSLSGVKIEDGFLNYNSSGFPQWEIADNSECSGYKTHFTHSWLKERGVDIEQLQEVYEEIEVVE